MLPAGVVDPRRFPGGSWRGSQDGIDGIRLLIVHYLDVTEYRKSLFYATMVVSVILVIAGGLPILLFALE